MTEPLHRIRAECFMPCDGAQEANGKLHILGGGWDTLLGSSFPLTHNQFALAIRLAVPWVEANRPRAFRIELRDEDGRSILPAPIEGTFTVGRPPTAMEGDDLPVLLAVTLVQITFPTPGIYTFHLLVDGEEVAKTKLRARKLG